MPIDEDYWHDPHPLHTRLAEQGPIHRMCLPDQIPVWLVTGYEEVRAGLRDQRLARNRKYAGPDYTCTTYPEGQDYTRLITEDPPEHTATRRLINFAFTPRRIEQIQPKIHEITAELLDGVERAAAANAGVVDLMPSYFAPLPISVISGILGLPAEHLDRVLAVTNAEFALAEGRFDGPVDTDPFGAAAATALGELGQIIIELVQDRRTDPTEDLISHWATATDERGDLLPVTDIMGMVLILYLGGYDTTAGMLVSSTLDLLEHPEQLVRLRADPDLFPAAVEELLRRNSSVLRGFRRFATEDLAIGGQPIAAGDTVLLSISAANRDRAMFADAQVFDLERPGNDLHIAFGYGPHHCPGHRLATVEVQIALQALFQRFPDIEITVPREQIPWRRSSFCRASYGLPARVRK
ncbi:MAG TPA: cytochrome P450 [Actinophytocola sp.]|uniref:cytochrome P450 family protein n=1 Tax=Actinophytocola sp. TaxID=1872138 RepID=UPI002DB55F68|nr:cytochrome P450 [Actinophytocola sp.]HEU5470913.1 cytochrome P450 [Actinophytocola sp.]